jgi:hypothetical protein
MYTLVYVSRAAQPFPDDQLDKILEQSRRNNGKLGITGLLLFKDGNFMQFLEGPKDSVLELLAKIKVDPRHHGLMVLSQQEHAQREFVSWAMAFERLDNTYSPPPGFTDLWELPFTSEEFLVEPTRCLEFLLSFKKLAS